MCNNVNGDNVLCKYPNVKVQLVGEDGNAFAILGRVSKAMRRANISKEEIDQFMSEAMSGDYDNLLQTCIKWVDCDGMFSEDEEDYDEDDWMQ